MYKEKKINDYSLNSQKIYPLSIRIWHWTNATLIICTLLIVLVNFTLLKPGNNSQAVQTKLRSEGISYSSQRATELAQYFSDRLWVVHAYIGFVLAALLIFRILLEIFLPYEYSLIGKIRKTFRVFKQQAKDTSNLTHNNRVKFSYCIFYLLFLTMALTGISVAYQNEIFFLKGNIYAINLILKIHYYTMYPFIAFILFHVSGVILAERKKNSGIVSNMINGGKRNI